MKKNIFCFQKKIYIPIDVIDEMVQAGIVLAKKAYIWFTENV